ncbi:SMI1/KNR4 family protein [Limibacter armeniacum]|uniref:SMI1/KNR4 family protein n=1 Tax=Limibacter armeniacum TaxID=466084 RepID=UPI002FE5310D
MNLLKVLIINDMQELTIEIQGKKVTLEELTSFEKELDMTLPDIYKEVLLKYGGSRVKENTYSSKASISFFLSLSSKRNATAKNIIETYKEEYGAALWLPFATDSGGWVFNISIAKDTYGQVWIDKFDSGDSDPFEYVSPSLEEFIDSLKSSE